MREGRFGFLGILTVLLALSQAAQASDVEVSKPMISVSGHGYHCNVVRLDLAKGRLAPRVITAQSGIGRTDSFETMVKSSRAVAAINGSFFDAYNKVGDMDPGMTLIRGGQVIHKGMTGTVIGFSPKSIVMGRLNLPIRGSIKQPGGRIVNWYAYWMNRKPTSADSITIFTPARGARPRVTDGICVVVNRNQVVEKIVAGDTPIPPLGYIIYLRGNEKQMVNQFPVGAEVGFQVIRDAGPESNAWQDVTEGVGAGPRLLQNGAPIWQPVEEGFREPKILTNHGQRSAIGVTRDGKILLVTVSGPTVREMTDIMKKLGAYQAMNLDGGASSALYANGHFLTGAGRQLSNSLIFYRR